MGGPNLDELIGRRARRGRPPVLTPEERSRRQALTQRAQGLARSALVQLHKDDYDALYAQAKAKVGLD
jgi:hypothetical protein